jgi:glutaredoxin-dependent peroxiredoxin
MNTQAAGSLKPGDTAPHFRLFNTEKKAVTLEDYKGKNLVVHFFPLAFTSTCTKQLCTVRDAISLYANDTTDVVAISIDTPQTLARFREEQKLNFPLLSDFNKEAGAAYGAQYEVFSCELRKVDKRAAFVIDKEGIIRYAEVLEDSGLLPDFNKINATLESL